MFLFFSIIIRDMKDVYDPTIKENGYFTQRFLTLKRIIIGSSLTAGSLGLVIGISTLIEWGQFFSYWLLSSLLIWVGMFLLLSILFLFHWEMVVLNAHGIKFRALGKKHDKNFFWRDLLKLEITFVVRKTKTYDEETGSGIAHHPILMIDVVLIEGEKQSLEVWVDNAQFSYTKRLTDAEFEKFVSEWVQNQTQAILVKPKFEKCKPRSQEKFRYTWEFERSP